MAKCFKCGNELPKMVMEPNKPYCAGHYESSDMLAIKRREFAVVEAALTLCECMPEKKADFSDMYQVVVIMAEKILSAKEVSRG